MTSFDTILRQNKLRFAADIDEDERQDIYDFWESLEDGMGDELSDTALEQVLDTYKALGLLEEGLAVPSHNGKTGEEKSQKEKNGAKGGSSAEGASEKAAGTAGETSGRASSAAAGYSGKDAAEKGHFGDDPCEAQKIAKEGGAKEVPAIRKERERREERERSKEKARLDSLSTNDQKADDANYLPRILYQDCHVFSPEQPMLVLEDEDGNLPPRMTGSLTNPARGKRFEYWTQPEEEDEDPKLCFVHVKSVDRRLVRLLKWAGEQHISLELGGEHQGDGYAVWRMRAGLKTEIGSRVIDNELLQLMINRMAATIMKPPANARPGRYPARDMQGMAAGQAALPGQPMSGQGAYDHPGGMAGEDGSQGFGQQDNLDSELERENQQQKQPLLLNDMESIEQFVTCAGESLPQNIRSWANHNIALVKSDSISTEEKRHAQRALSLMLHVQWDDPSFPAIDAKRAAKILDDQLYGLKKVKQRVMETIIQINRTHTLPAYGLLLNGPAGIGKSQIAYAVAKIIGLPWTVLDMSTIHSAEGLTGTPRIYSNAKPGKIMNAFYQAGSSNLVFIINELDKASDAAGSGGNPADALLTLLDNLGFTDDYMECQIPTGGVYTIATSNDKEKISSPLLSRFAVIDIPDYTRDEKEIIFRDFVLPKILRRMQMKPEECQVTDKAVSTVVDYFSGTTGVRDLEQTAEHLAANALFRIETENIDKVVYNEEDVKQLLEF